MSAWVGRSPGRPFARIPRAIPAGRVPRICGDVKGSEVSLGRFFQNLLVESKVGNGSLQPSVFLLKLFELSRLVEVEPTVFASPPVVGVVGDTDLSYCLPDTLATHNGNFDLPELLSTCSGL